LAVPCGPGHLLLSPVLSCRFFEFPDGYDGQKYDQEIGERYIENIISGMAVADDNQKRNFYHLQFVE